MRIFTIPVCWVFIGLFYTAQRDGDKAFAVQILSGYYHVWFADFKYTHL